MKLKLLLCAALAFFAFGASAQAQTPVVVQCSVNNPTNPWVPCSSGNPLPVSASVTASIAPFLPSASGSRGTQFTVNTTTTSQTLPTGAAVVVSNVGTTNTMYCNAVGVAATTSDEPISPNGGWFVFGTANAGGSINCIASGGTTTANMVGGGGLPSGTGGGSGGSGGTVNQGTGGASAWLVTGTAGTFPATQSGTWNITNISGTVSLPTGAATSALQGTNTATTAHTCSTGGYSEIGCLGQIDDDVKSPIAAGTNVIGYTSNDPCSQATKLGAPISLTASGQVITGTASKKTYICSIDLISATAQNIALVEGTGTTCATNIFGLAGGTTAATGWNLAANGGLTKGSGAGTVYSPSADTNATAANVCILLSSTGQTSGQITYVQQ